MYEYKVVMDEFNSKDAYDGDTVKFTVDLGFDIRFKIKVRLAGIDTPELTKAEKEDGLASRDFLRGQLLVAKEQNKEVKVRTYKDGKGKYGRYIATIFIDGENINQVMIDAGHAVKY